MADLRLVAAPGECAWESSEGSAIRVVLAEDHVGLRDALRAVLQAADGVELVGEAADWASALRLVRRDGPDVLVLDFGMVSGSGRERIAALRAQAPATQVVVIALEESPALARYLFAAGAVGFVLKDRADVELPDAVRAAERRREYVSPCLADRLGALRRSAVEL